MTIQTKQAPLSSNEDVNLYKTLLDNSDINYDNIGILLDEPTYNIILILFLDGVIVDLFRMNLETEDFSNNVFTFTLSNQVQIRVLQGEYITPAQLTSLDSIQDIWSKTKEQRLNVDKDELKSYISRIWSRTKNKGRGDSFSTETKRIVRETSHGRCMYKGCGLKLTFDATTGVEGNYGYLAHNVASSEQAARGLILISEKLSDEPNNVLHLCDKHHRLIDKIAVAAHPAYLLSKMREEFIELSENLLNGLKYQPCLTFSILFPVRQNIIQKPTSMQIASSLAIKHLRQSGSLLDLLDNETAHLDENNTIYWELMKMAILRVSDKVVAQCTHEKINVAIFAFGSMPALIALGAILGNKRGYIPILNNRQLGHWGWGNKST